MGREEQVTYRTPGQRQRQRGSRSSPLELLPHVRGEAPQQALNEGKPQGRGVGRGSRAASPHTTGTRSSGSRAPSSWDGLVHRKGALGRANQTREWKTHSLRGPSEQGCAQSWPKKHPTDPEEIGLQLPEGGRIPGSTREAAASGVARTAGSPAAGGRCCTQSPGMAMSLRRPCPPHGDGLWDEAEAHRGRHGTVTRKGTETRLGRKGQHHSDLG